MSSNSVPLFRKRPEKTKNKTTSTTSIEPKGISCTTSTTQISDSIVDTSFFDLSSSTKKKHTSKTAEHEEEKKSEQSSSKVREESKTPLTDFLRVVARQIVEENSDVGTQSEPSHQARSSKTSKRVQSKSKSTQTKVKVLSRSETEIWENYPNINLRRRFADVDEICIVLANSRDELCHLFRSIFLNLMDLSRPE